MRPRLFRSAVALAVLGFSILLLPSAAFALSTGNGAWRWQNPLPQGALYQRGWFLDARHGWLISGGDIFHTADGGATLTVQSRNNVRFNDITFVDGRHGWAVGDPATTRGTAIVFRTTDGRHWKRVRLHLLGGLSAVSFSTAKVGWAVGGTEALHTIDGGLHWTFRKVPHADWLVDVRALGQRHAMLCDDVDAMLRTDDGGRTWRRFVVLHPSQPSAIRFTSLRNGWVSSDQGVLHTSDGGAHWTMQLAISRGAGGLAFANSSVGWATTSDGVFRTVDGGAHWVPQTTVPPTGWAWVVARGTSAAVLGAGSQLTHTTDGGATWTPVIAPADDFSGRLAAVKFADADTGWTVGEAGEILATTDGGGQWSAQQSATDQDLNDLAFVDANDGWAVGGESDFSSGAASAVVVHTSDGGTTWTPQTSGIAGIADPLTGVSFVDASNGWAVGGKDSMDESDGVVLHTTNGGQSWAPQTIPDTRVQLNGVAFADARHGWAVGSIAGDAGENVTVIMGTSDGGAIWTKQLTYTPPAGGNSSNATLTSVACADARHAVAVGSGEGETEIFRTADGGTTWRKISFPAQGWIDLEHVAFVDATHGWAVGDGTVIATTDGGRTWTRQSVGPNDSLSGLSFVSRTRGWVVGGGADILTTTTGGIAP